MFRAHGTEHGPPFLKTKRSRQPLPSVSAGKREKTFPAIAVLPRYLGTNHLLEQYLERMESDQVTYHQKIQLGNKVTQVKIN